MPSLQHAGSAVVLLCLSPADSSILLPAIPSHLCWFPSGNHSSRITSDSRYSFKWKDGFKWARRCVAWNGFQMSEGACHMYFLWRISLLIMSLEIVVNWQWFPLCSLRVRSSLMEVVLRCIESFLLKFFQFCLLFCVCVCETMSKTFFSLSILVLVLLKPANSGEQLWALELTILTIAY